MSFPDKFTSSPLAQGFLRSALTSISTHTHHHTPSLITHPLKPKERMGRVPPVNLSLRSLVLIGFCNGQLLPTGILPGNMLLTNYIHNNKHKGCRRRWTEKGFGVGRQVRNFSGRTPLGCLGSPSNFMRLNFSDFHRSIPGLVVWSALLGYGTVPTEARWTWPASREPGSGYVCAVWVCFCALRCINIRW